MACAQVLAYTKKCTASVRACHVGFAAFCRGLSKVHDQTYMRRKEPPALQKAGERAVSARNFRKRLLQQQCMNVSVLCPSKGTRHLDGQGRRWENFYLLDPPPICSSRCLGHHVATELPSLGTRNLPGAQRAPAISLECPSRIQMSHPTEKSSSAARHGRWRSERKTRRLSLSHGPGLARAKGRGFPSVDFLCCFVAQMVPKRTLTSHRSRVSQCRRQSHLKVASAARGTMLSCVKMERSTQLVFQALELQMHQF